MIEKLINRVRKKTSHMNSDADHQNKNLHREVGTRNCTRHLEAGIQYLNKCVIQSDKIISLIIFRDKNHVQNLSLARQNLTEKGLPEIYNTYLKELTDVILLSTLVFFRKRSFF